MRSAFWALVMASPAAAHVMSMSTGELTINGARAHYELRIPLYEVAHVQQPQDSLLANMRFAGARMVSKACAPDPASESYVCTAEYSFAKPVDEVSVECTLPSVTVPNHIHLLHATLGDKREEAVFDSALTKTKLRFHAAGAGEAAVTEAVAGFLQALGGPVQVLFLLALALAARSPRELATMALAFIVGECVGVAATPFTGWQPAPRFVEAAAALTIAYLAVELLLLPKAGARWLVAGALGCFHGLWLLLFVESTRYHAALVLLGAAAAQAAVLAAMSWALSRVALRRATPAVAGMLLVFGMAWFWMRLRG
ncbi:MAG TPA: HupE/UreJ family protein [Candidatus Acidoferrum sp.]|nr:HupE/UreJ family protein [Candidatus Acidoferrum sp.]